LYHSNAVAVRKPIGWGPCRVPACGSLRPVLPRPLPSVSERSPAIAACRSCARPPRASTNG
jgi:hypothetical protein